MLVVSKYLVPKGYAAMAVFFVFFKYKKYLNPIRLNHEKIHLRQQLELFNFTVFIFGIEFFKKIGSKYKGLRKKPIIIFLLKSKPIKTKPI